MIVGDNGHGKTSLIEALLYGEVFRSFRGAADRDLVAFGADGFHVRAVADGQAVAAGFDARTREKRVTVAGAAPERLSRAIGIVRGVVLSPGDVRLVAGGPRERRHYLDVLLSLTVRGYVEALTRYRRALPQRLRAAAEAPAWERVLAENGEIIAAARHDWAARWAPRYAELCVAIGEEAGGDGPALAHVAKTEPTADAIAVALERSREKDRVRGRTSTGPHRDELRLSLGGRDLRTYGSAGQQRTAALALRMLEAESLAAARAGGVTLCLDDAFAELDAARSRRLGELIERMAASGTQIVAAVPKRSDVPDVIASLTTYGIRRGRVSSPEA